MNDRDDDRDYDADFVAGIRWYDYVLSIPLVALCYPVRAVAWVRWRLRRDRVG